MVLEADRLGCADEVIVIAAALSIQDPRERPADKQAQADQPHARFADEHSDFLAYLNLWRYLREQQRELSGNQFRKRCQGRVPALPAHPRVAGPRRPAAPGGQGGRRHAQPRRRPSPSDIHVALLSGLLSHVGLRDAARREYLGARGARFAIFPGSALARQQPAWVMVAELVETSRLWGRDRRADRARAGSSRSPGTWSSARTPSRAGSAGAASVVATERVTLYGLPIVAGRTVAYGADRPGARRASCSSAARWSRATGTRATRSSPTTRALRRGGRGARGPRAPARHPRRRRRRCTTSSTRAIPADVVSGAHFDRWWRDARRARPGPADLHARAAARRRGGRRARPARLAGRPGARATSSCALTYRFEPGAERRRRDRARAARARSAQLRADRLRVARPRRCARSSSTALLRSLPKELRRPLVPVPEIAAAVLERAASRAARRCSTRWPREIERAARRAGPADGVGPRPAARRTCG